MRFICGQTDDVTSDQYALILLLGLPQALQDGSVQIYSRVVQEKIERCYAFPSSCEGMAVPPVDSDAPCS